MGDEVTSRESRSVQRQSELFIRAQARWGREGFWEVGRHPVRGHLRRGAVPAGTLGRPCSDGDPTR